MTQKEYQALVKKHSPNSPILKNCLWAFFVGGAICLLGQVLGNLYKKLPLDESQCSMLVSVTLIGLSVFFTGLSLYDDLAKHAGAGTLVPITGFANAVSAPAVEFRTEGFVLGTAAKMFTIAGPVIVYGISASIVYGIVYWICAFF